MCGRCGGSGTSGGGGRSQDPSEKFFFFTNLFTNDLSDAATAWSQTKIKVKGRKCDWVTFLTHDFT